MTANNGSANRRHWVLAAIERYEGQLTRYACRMLGDEHAARDVVQHTFLKLCDAAPEEVDKHLAQWLYLVCRNKSLDLLRKDGRLEALDSASSDRLTAGDAGPAELAEQRDLVTWLRGLVAELPASQREVVLLSLDGFSYREISSITGRSEGHLRVLAHRALGFLRQHPTTLQLLGHANNARPDLTTNTP